MTELNPTTTHKVSADPTRVKQQGLTEMACRGCGVTFPINREHFYYMPSKKRWVRWCIPCYKINVVKKPYGDAQKARDLAGRRTQHRRYKLQIIEAYGGRCACCAEAIPEFLTIDHVNGNGAVERSSGLIGIKLFRHIINSGFPPAYQILCFNCNCAKGSYGVCPHQWPTQD